MAEVRWTRAKLVLFKAAYSLAEELGQTIFTFEGNEYHIGYAKYLIEYLEGVFI